MVKEIALMEVMKGLELRIPALKDPPFRCNADNKLHIVRSLPIIGDEDHRRRNPIWKVTSFQKALKNRQKSHSEITANQPNLNCI